jgi:hypothetical protein
MTLYLPTLSFVAVPKTATIAIETTFFPYAINFKPHQHDSVDIVKYYSSNPCIAVIRHPLDWIKSYYKYLRYSPYFARTDSIWGLYSKSFEEFVWAYIKGQHMWPEPLNNQKSYVFYNNKKVEFLYRYDNLSKVVNHLCLSLEIKLDINKHNVSKKIDLELSKKALFAFEIFAKEDYDLYESI